MYYDDVFVDYLVDEMRGPKGDEYVRRIAIARGPELVARPETYKTFGVYWWAMKDALKQYAGLVDAWFMGSHDDIVMKARAWHGSAFRTILAANYFHSRQTENTSRHRWTDVYGIEHDYTLFDPDAGC